MSANVQTQTTAPSSPQQKETRGVRGGFARFLRHRVAVGASVVLLTIIAISIGAPLLTHYGPNQLALLSPYLAPGTGGHVLGTNALGEDVWTRLLYGGRVSLLVAFAAATMASVLGIAVGSLAGYYGHWVDNILMRFVDLVLSFPDLFLLLVLASYTGLSEGTMILFIGGFSWMGMARMVRGVFLTLRELPMVESARAIGAGSWRIILRYLLPGAMGPVIVALTFAVARAMLLEAALDFLGFGISPSVPTWGNMLVSAQQSLSAQPLAVVAPGLMITATVLSLNFIGDGLRGMWVTQGRAI